MTHPTVEQPTFPVFLVIRPPNGELRTTELEVALEFAADASTRQGRPVAVESVNVPLSLPRQTVAVFPPTS